MRTAPFDENEAENFLLVLSSFVSVRTGVDFLEKRGFLSALGESVTVFVSLGSTVCDTMSSELSAVFIRGGVREGSAAGAVCAKAMGAWDSGVEEKEDWGESGGGCDGCEPEVTKDAEVGCCCSGAVSDEALVADWSPSSF